MMYKNQSGSSERANEIRAEIARLQQELASIKKEDQPKYSKEFFNWLKSQARNFLIQGRFEYFSVNERGNPIFEPSLAANEVELSRFKKFRDRGRLPEEYGKQTQAISTPSPSSAPVIGQSSANPTNNMPPAWI